MTKIAVSCDEPSLDAAVDPRFGRAGGFLLVDSDTMEFTYIQNGQAQTMARGAGIQAAETVAQAGAQVVLTGFVGPKAFQALTAAGVQIGQELTDLTVRQAVQRYLDGQVPLADAHNSPAHSGGGQRGGGMGGGGMGMGGRGGGGRRWQ